MNPHVIFTVISAMSVESIVATRNRNINENISSICYNFRGIMDELAKPKPDFESIDTHYLRINGYLYEISWCEYVIKALRRYPDKSVIEAKRCVLEKLIVLTAYVKSKYNKYI